MIEEASNSPDKEQGQIANDDNANGNRANISKSV